MGQVLGDAMHAALKGLPNVIGIRTLGLAGAVELTGIAGAPGKRAYDIFLDCYHHGVLVRPAAENLVLCPPYIVSPAQIEQMVGTLAASIKKYALP
jgi:beta-alanine--pyruvate transaminase